MSPGDILIDIISGWDARYKEKKKVHKMWKTDYQIFNTSDFYYKWMWKKRISLVELKKTKKEIYSHTLLCFILKRKYVEIMFLWILYKKLYPSELKFHVNFYILHKKKKLLKRFNGS